MNTDPRPFDDALLSQRASPLARTHEDFPFDEVCQRLDGTPPRTPDTEQALETVRATLLWIGDALRSRKNRSRAHLAGLRSLAAIYCLSPALLPSPNLRELARSLGLSYKRLSQITSAASKIMQVKNPSQAASHGYRHLHGPTRLTPRPAHIVECFIRGRPLPQPRARATWHNGRPVWYTPGGVNAWKRTVQITLLQAGLPPREVRERGAVHLETRFAFPRPRTQYRAAGHLRPDAPTFHVQRPDLDNLLKAVMDALTETGAWHDDAQVFSVRAARQWCESIETAGCHLVIAWQLPSTLHDRAPDAHPPARTRP